MSGGPVTRGLSQKPRAIAEQATKTFEEATTQVTPAAQSLIGRLRSLDNPPQENGLEFGISLTAQAGAFIATVGGEANFKVTLKWSSPNRSV